MEQRIPDHLRVEDPLRQGGRREALDRLADLNLARNLLVDRVRSEVEALEVLRASPVVVRVPKVADLAKTR